MVKLDIMIIMLLCFVIDPALSEVRLKCLICRPPSRIFV